MGLLARGKGNRRVRADIVEHSKQFALCGQRQFLGSPLIAPVLAAQIAIMLRSKPIIALPA
jgi:hypothetical protein